MTAEETQECLNCGDELNDIGWLFDPCPASPDGSGDHTASRPEDELALAQWETDGGT